MTRPSAQVLQRIEQILAQMDPLTREIFLLHRIDDWPYPRIAHALGISVDEVEKHIACGIAEIDQGLRRDGL